MPSRRPRPDRPTSSLTPDPSERGAEAQPARRRPYSSIELAAVGVLVLLAVRVGLKPITDNSMLLHLRTGVDMVSSGHIPRHDPYSFTAPGHAWVVQSWLAELSYGVAHWIGGYRAVVFEQAVLMGALALLTALLARADRPAGTIVAAGSTVMAGIVLWAPRPFLIGLIGTAVLLLLVERRRSPWWLVPVLWVWVNSHGSFPLGIAWLVARYVGAAIDERRRPRWLEPYALAFVVGLAVAAVNPLGPRLLAFPLVVQAHHKVFQLIIEWRSPNFQLGYALAALTALSVGLLFLLRRGAPWADVLPVVGFLVAGLISERNLPFAAIVLAPALGRALSAGTSPPVARPANPSGLPPPVVPALVIAGIALVVFSTRTSPVDLNGYPVAGERYLAAHGLLTTGHRIAAADVVGDFREFVEGPKGNVFIDDRYDMFPTAVVDDSQAIAAGQGTALDVLRRRNIDIVLWKRGEGPMSLLHAVGGWRTIYSDAHWEIMQRTPSLS